MASSILSKVYTAGIMLGASELCNAEEEQVNILRDKLENHHMTVAVIGQFKRGKSTLVNSLLGTDILPTGIIPITAAVTLITYGEPSAQVHFKNGRVQPTTLETMGEYISEQKNPDNVLGVSHVSMTTPSPFLKEGLTFVDTPGVGSIHKHNSEAAYAFVKESDAVIFTLSVDSPINEIEIEFLRNAREYAGKFYFAVNKIDVVEEEELSSYLYYCQKLLSDLMEVDEVKIYPVSARKGTGLEELKAKLTGDAASEVRQILEESARKKLINLINSSLGQLELYWSALKSPPSLFHSRFSRLNNAFNELQKNSIEDAKELEEKGLKMMDTLRGQYQERSEFFDFTDDTALTQQLTRLYSQQLTSVETIIQKTSDLLFVRANELKQELSETVTRLFAMDYHYPIAEVTMTEEDAPSDMHKERVQDFVKNTLPSAMDMGSKAIEKAMMESYEALLTGEIGKLIENFEKDTRVVCDQLNDTLNSIMLYREEHSGNVIQRIGNLNKLIKKLRALRDDLYRM